MTWVKKRGNFTRGEGRGRKRVRSETLGVAVSADANGIEPGYPARGGDWKAAKISYENEEEPQNDPNHVSVTPV